MSPSDNAHIKEHKNTAQDVKSSAFLSDVLAKLFEGDDLASLTEQTALAFLDLLTAALVADGYPEQEEVEAFRAQVELLPFIPDDRAFVKARVEQTIATLQRLTEHEATAHFARVAQPIEAGHMRARAFRMAVIVSHADFAITRNEHALLKHIAQGLGLDPQRAADMIQDVRTQHEEGLLF